MEILVNADEFEAEIDVRGVQLTSPEGAIVLVGSEEDVLALIGRVAELFNYEIAQRDPGPSDLFERVAAITRFDARDRFGHPDTYLGLNGR